MTRSWDFLDLSTDRPVAQEVRRPLVQLEALAQGGVEALVEDELVNEDVEEALCLAAVLLPISEVE